MPATMSRHVFARPSSGILSTAISSTSKDDGWSHLAEVGSFLVKSHAAFNPTRLRGYAKLGELVRGAAYVEVKDVPGPTRLGQSVPPPATADTSAVDHWAVPMLLHGAR